LEVNGCNFYSESCKVKYDERLIAYKFVLRVQADFWLPDKTILLWIGIVIVLVVSLVLAPGISKFVSHCRQKKEDSSPSEVVYVRNPGESLLSELRLIQLCLP
jgi:hypothetical protein